MGRICSASGLPGSDKDDAEEKAGDYCQLDNSENTFNIYFPL